MLQKLLFVLPLAVAVLAQNTTPGYPQTVQPGMTVSYPYAPDHFDYPIPTMPGQTLQPGVIYEPKIIFVPKISQPTADTGVTPKAKTRVTPKPTTRVTRKPTTRVTRKPTTRVTPKPITRVTPKAITRVTPKVATQTPHNKVVIIKPRPRPRGPSKTKFQCPKSYGFYSVANSCHAYFECKGYLAKRRICPNGLYFNPAAKYSNYSPCSHPSEVQCTAGNVIQRRPTNPTDQCPAQFGSFAINDGECSRYIVCQEGLATIMNCPMGLVFNDQTQSCDWPINVPQCTPNVFKDFTCPAPPVEKNGEISDVIYKYRYGSQCKSFVACQKGYPRLLSCDPGLAFDETSQICISEELVTNCAAPYSAAAA